MKKIFILTGEPSGDKLAKKTISELQRINKEINYFSVGGEHLRSIGIDSIFDLKEITYLGFTKVVLNIFKIKKKINYSVKKILEFNPDILLSIDSPDFTLRVAKAVKEKNPNIKTIHYVSPHVWIWRKGRAKKISKFIDHILLLFSFEKKYYKSETIKSTFVGHPLLDDSNKKSVDLSQLVKSEKKIISVFPGSRITEINMLMPILIETIELINNKYDNLTFVFHATQEFKLIVKDLLDKSNTQNTEVVSDEIIKSNILSKSFFAIAKSGTISLEICNAEVPSLIIYRMSWLNYCLIKFVTNFKYVNIFNIISNSEVIPELLQSKCNSRNIYKSVCLFIEDEKKGQIQVLEFKKILNEIKSSSSSSKKVASILNESLK